MISKRIEAAKQQKRHCGCDVLRTPFEAIVMVNFVARGPSRISFARSTVGLRLGLGRRGAVNDDLCSLLVVAT